MLEGKRKLNSFHRMAKGPDSYTTNMHAHLTGRASDLKVTFVIDGRRATPSGATTSRGKAGAEV